MHTGTIPAGRDRPARGPPAGVGDHAASLSCRGIAAGLAAPVRATIGALPGVVGLGILALSMILQSFVASGSVAGEWTLAVMISGFWALPAVALGGSFRRPAGAPPEPEL